MNSELEFSTQAYCKIVMHVMKHCHTTCTGLLLSPNPKVSSRQGDTQEGSSNRLVIIDSIPLFHHGTNSTTPNYEIALNSVAVYAQHQQLRISGIYQANRAESDNTPDIFSRRITEKISEAGNENAVLCMIDNYGFQSMEAHSILRPYQLVDGRLKPTNTSVTVEGNNNERLNKEILLSKDKLYRAIVDFDDHLDDISLDWTNARVTQKIDYLCAHIC